ncbi:MAG TPA: polysaccharide biosynthesis tyrosine autokinase [Puia sp.]
MQSSMLIKNDQNNGGGKEERFDELFIGGDNSNLSNEIEILRSRPILQRVANDLGLQTAYYNEGKVKTSLLYRDVPFSLIVPAFDSVADFSFKVTIIDASKFILNEDKTPIAFGEPFTIGNMPCRLVRNPAVHLQLYGSMKFIINRTSLSNAAENLKSVITVGHPNEQSTILNLAFEGPNPDMGKDILNMLMSVYDSSVVEAKIRIDANTLNFINTQLYQLSDTLTGVQGGLSNYMSKNQIFDIENQSKDFLDKLGESVQNENAQTLRLTVLNWLLSYIGDQKNTYGLVPTNLGIEEPALLQLIGEYNRLQLQREANLKTTTADNPLIVGLESALDKTRGNIYQALLNVKKAYELALANIEKHKEQLQSGVTSLPGKSIHLLNIQRRQKILEELYALLLQKKLETSIAYASVISNSTVLEPALSGGNQVSPNSTKTYTVYFFVGLLIPFAIIALKEMLKDKVANRGDVEKYTQAPILGEIGHSGNDQTLVVSRNSRRFIAEQFRIIRTNLQYIISKSEKPIIMITSSISGEGKSFISTNIGAVMALADKKTVIMEFDIRKPKIVSGLDLKRKMGITNYIIGNVKFEDLIVKVEGQENLFVIPCGPIPPNPAELLLEHRLDELMREVRERFDVIIMDTAPVGLVSDAISLGRYADCTLYIIRQGYTLRKQVTLIEELYLQQKLPRISLLLNDVKAEGGYYGGGYYGSYGYYGGYGYGAESGYFENEKGQRTKRSFFSSIMALLHRIFR